MWFFLFILINLPVHNTDRYDEFISFSDARELTWSDFKGRPNANKRVVAVTTSGLYLETLEINERERSITVLIEARFYPKLSWYRRGSSEHVLEHERKHFEITEIHARLLRQYLNGRTLPASRFNSSITKIKKKYDRKNEKYQKKYDRRTRHSINVSRQLVWNKSIERELNSLRSHRTNIIKVYFN